MFCYRCGREIAENVAVCPYCGTFQPVHTAYDSNEKNEKITPYNALCVIGFTVSCISFFINPRGLFSVAGIIISVIGMFSAGKRCERGRTLAVWGIAIGVVKIILTAIWMYQIYQYTAGILGGFPFKEFPLEGIPFPSLQ